MHNLSYFLTRTARAHGSKTAVVHGDEVHDYAWLSNRVSQLAKGLSDLGLKPGDRVGLIVDNTPTGLIALFAPLRAGMAVVPMNPKLHPQEHAYMVENSEVRALIVSPRFVKGLLEARPDLPEQVKFMVLDSVEQDDERLLLADRYFTRETVEFEDVKVDADDTAWLFYTSGTTGRPKAAMLSHKNLTTLAISHLIEANPAKRSDCLAYIAPITHASGLVSFHHVACGATLVFPEFKNFTAENFFALVARHRITTTIMVPTMVQILLDDANKDGHDISSLHTILYGGAPMYVDRIKEAVETFGPIFVQGFGQGEAPMSCTYLPREDHIVKNEVMEKRLGSVGRECMFVKIRIFDDEGNELPRGAVGEVVVSGDLVMKGYWKNQEADNAAFYGEWLRTGDVGYLDEAGYLFLTDRKKDMIISGGYNIYPREIEEILYQHPEVHEATVFGLPDPKWGEKVVAVIVRKSSSDLNADNVIEWCRSNLGSFKKPSQVHFIDELPKSGYGKILKREVRQRFLAEA